MNGNHPYGGKPTTVPAGIRSPDDVNTLSTEEKRQFKQALHQITNIVEEYLPYIYGVSAGLTQSPTGVQGLITISSPMGNVIGTNVSPPTNDSPFLDKKQRKEIAQEVVVAAVSTTIKQTNGTPPKYAK